MKTKLLMTAIASIAAFSATAANSQDVTAHTVYYNHDSAQTSEIQNQLDQIVNSCSVERIQIVCHTDTTGPASYNQSLSERRAVDLMNELIARGVSQNSMTTSGQGETNNAVDRGDNVREELNRRCEIVTSCAAAFAEPVQSYEQVQTYEPVQSVETYSETVVDTLPYETPTPIDSTQVVTEVPYSAPQVYNPVSSAPTGPAPGSAPYIPSTAPVPPVLPSTGGVIGGISPLVLAGGAAGIIAAVVLIADDDEPNSP